MATTFGFFADAALTTALGSGITATQKADAGVVDPVVTQVWFGSLGSAGGDTTDRKLEANSDPGVDQINFNVAATGGAAHSTSEVKLATSLPGDWSTVTGGAGVSVGTSLVSGTVNAITLFIQVDDATHVVSLLTELSVLTDSLLESPV